MRANSNKGFILVVALLVVGIIGILVAGSLVLSMTNKKITRNDALTSQVLNVAQAGNAYWKAELVSLYAFMVDNFDKYADAINAYEAKGNPISCGNYFAIGLDLNRDYKIDIPNDPKDPKPLPILTIPMGSGSGDVVVRFSVVGSAIRLESEGNYADAASRVIEEFNISNVDIWNNAVFADSSAANATIQGRAEIRGAIHLLGTGLSASDEALDLSGNFGMGNTYRGLNPSLNVTSADMRLSNADPLDLCATLRVKSGYVNLTGSGTIGYPEATNGTENGYEIIDNVRGIYTNHGIKGGKDASDPSVSKANVYSQNGMTAKYDAGENFKFPLLDDPISKTNTTTWAQQIEQNALILDIRGLATNTGLNPDNSQDDRIKIKNGQEKKVGGKPYKLVGDCANSDGGALFGTDGKGVAPVANPIPLSGLPDLRQELLTVAGILQPHLTRALLPVLATLGTHKDSHQNGTGGTITVSVNEFEIKYGSTPSFTCAKYQVGGNPNGTDRLIAEVRWDKANNTLYVNGALMLVGGNLRIGGGSGNREIVYKGNGVIFTEHTKLSTGAYAGGNIYTQVDFLPGGGKAPTICTSTSGSCKGVGMSDNLYPSDPTLPNNLYPNTALLGIVARERFISEGNSQTRLTLAAYAENSVKITQQTLVAGAIVTQKFDAGNQVPTVLYVPNLSERLSYLMPGAGGKGFAVSNVAWSRSY